MPEERLILHPRRCEMRKLAANFSRTLLFFLSVLLILPSCGAWAAVPSLAGGANHTIVLRDDATVWAWGNNQYGQLGNGTSTDSKTAAQVSDLENIIAIASGANHSIALRSDGTVLTWGRNFHGQLGNGITGNISKKPVRVPGLTNVKAIAGGGSHTVALMEDGTVRTWGWNFFGQLGDRSNTDRAAPVQVPDLENVRAIAAGETHTMALMDDDTVRTWGCNSYGQLGHGTDTDSNRPVQVPGLNNLKAIACGGYHTIVLEDDGAVWAWGNNEYGQLGNGTEEISLIPVRAADLNHVISVAGGDMHTIAIRDDGTVWTWGNNEYGQLGDGTNTDSNVPVSVSSVFNVRQVISVAGGGSHTIALGNDGTVLAWGRNSYDQLGKSVRAQTGTPVQAYRLDNAIISVAGGELHTIALGEDGKVRTWGNNKYGQLGNGTNADTSVATEVKNLADAIAIAGGEMHTIALTENGTVMAWGGNEHGQLGNGTETDSNTPVQVSDLEDISAIASGSNHGMALGADGRVRTWGDNLHGQLGHGTFTNRNVPVQVPDLDEVTAIACGANHSIVIRSDRSVWAWGSNLHGQLGNGTFTDSSTPVQVINPGDESELLNNVSAIAGGNRHTMAVREGRVWTWGDNSRDQLGDGTTADSSSTPVQVSGIRSVRSLAGGYSHTVALKGDRSVWTWGDNSYGQVGGIPLPGKTRVRMADDITAIGAGVYHTVILRKDGTVWACGDNQYGQIGDGTEPWLLVQSEINLIGLPSVILVLRLLSGMAPETGVDDVNGDERIGMEEAVYYLQLIANMNGVCYQ